MKARRETPEGPYGVCSWVLISDHLVETIRTRPAIRNKKEGISSCGAHPTADMRPRKQVCDPYNRRREPSNVLHAPPRWMFRDPRPCPDNDLSRGDADSGRRHP